MYTSACIKTWILPFITFVFVSAIFYWSSKTDASTIIQESSTRMLQNKGEYVFADHKALYPFDSTDYIGVCCAIIGLMVAAGGGVGGGGILVPIYILVMGFSPKHAIPLSNVTVFGGAVANAVLNANKRHPLTDRPLVDWDLILVMEPLTIAGALVGAFLNKVLPSELLVIMLVLLLAFTAYTSLVQAVKMYKAETRQLHATSRESELTRLLEDETIHLPRLNEKDNSYGSTLTNVNFQEKELAQILEEERRTPMAKVYILAAMFLVLVVINILKGGGTFLSPLGIQCGSTSFWIANCVMFGWILVVSYFARFYLVKRFELKQRVGYLYVEGDIQWDGRATIVYPAICSFAGFFAGTFTWSAIHHVMDSFNAFCLLTTKVCCWCRNVWTWRRNCERYESFICCPLLLLLSHNSSWYTLATLRPPHVGNGSSPSSWVRNVCLYDFIHKPHCDDILCGIWSFVTGLCHCLSVCRISLYDPRSSWSDVFDGKVSSKLIHCLLNWGRCLAKYNLDGNSICCYIFEGKCPHRCRWNLREK